MILAEGDDPLRPVGQLLMPEDVIIPVEARAPDLARHPVAANIGADQLLEALAAVNVAAGDGGALAVREGEGRRENRGRAALAVRSYRLRALHYRPAVVAAAAHVVDHLPQLPADIADPQVAGE